MATVRATGTEVVQQIPIDILKITEELVDSAPFRDRLSLTGHDREIQVYPRLSIYMTLKHA